MTGTYEALDSLRKVLIARREQHKENLAKGRGDVAETVGRCKELEDSIEKISMQIKSLNRGEDE